MIPHHASRRIYSRPQVVRDGERGLKKDTRDCDALMDGRGKDTFLPSCPSFFLTDYLFQMNEVQNYHIRGGIDWILPCPMLRVCILGEVLDTYCGKGFEDE